MGVLDDFPAPPRAPPQVHGFGLMIFYLISLRTPILINKPHLPPMRGRTVSCSLAHPPDRSHALQVLEEILGFMVGDHVLLHRPIPGSSPLLSKSWKKSSA